MNVVRIWGNPFDQGDAGHGLREFLQLAAANGMRVGLCLTAVRDGAGTGDRVVELTDGVRSIPVRTSLPPLLLQQVVRAAAQPVPSTAPVVVFATDTDIADAVQLAGLEWPRACRLVKVAADATAAELLARVRSELRWAGTEDPAVGLDERELLPWLQLEPPDGEVILHDGSDDPADGSDIAVRVFASRFAAGGARLRVLLSDAAAIGPLRQAARAAAPAGLDGAAAIEFVVGTATAALLHDVSVIVQPLRSLRAPQRLVPLLASGRPVCISQFEAVARLLPTPSLCQPIGGRWLPCEQGAPPRFEPDPRALARGIEQLRRGDVGAAIARRARAHVLAEMTNDRPASPPRPPAQPARGRRPRLVLQAPFLETSSSAEFSIATAQALHRRGHVELALVPTLPFRQELATLRARAPELVPLLRRDVADADLWLASGWPLRHDRPPARCFALRVDWEFGALPVSLTPAVTQEADAVVVHSEYVFRSVTAAGRPADQVHLIPHGVDAAAFASTPALPQVLQWKQGRPAVLFVGGLIWRKGIDVFLRAVIEAARTAPPFCVVVKALGGNQHYGGFHMRELVQKVQRHPQAPPLLLLEDELSREQMVGLYRACDLMLLPYRGEGFCMPALEARGCGLPLLVTDGGATDDFAVGESVVKIAARRRPVDLPDVCVSQPWVLEPEDGAAGRALATSLHDLPRLAAAARREALAVLQECRWDAAAARLEQLASTAMGTVQVAPPAAPRLQPV